MDEEMNFKAPYYKTAYLDDNNIKHLAYIKDKETMDYLTERFTVLYSELETN